LQITEHFRELIKSGQLKEGDRLPSARQLVEQWHVAIATAARVLSTLRAEGLVRTIPGGGGGTVVAVQGIAYAPQDRVVAARRWGRIYPPGEHARIVAAELTVAPQHVADALGAEPGSPVIRRHRITLNGDTPVSASTSWFAGELAESAPLLLVAERLRQGTPRYIEEMTGRRAARGRDQFTTTLSNASIAADLAIDEGVPVLIGRNWFQDAEGGVVEFGEYVAVPNRWQTYEYELD
jgi:DNA-binding GntR family transcriptional regulator